MWRRYIKAERVWDKSIVLPCIAIANCAHRASLLQDEKSQPREGNQGNAEPQTLRVGEEYVLSEDPGNRRVHEGIVEDPCVEETPSRYEGTPFGSVSSRSEVNSPVGVAQPLGVLPCSGRDPKTTPEAEAVLCPTCQGEHPECSRCPNELRAKDGQVRPIANQERYCRY